jgi:hypothetical protein
MSCLLALARSASGLPAPGSVAAHVSHRRQSSRRLKMCSTRRHAVVVAVCALTIGAVLPLDALQTAAASNGAKIWIGRAAEMEAYLATAEVGRMEQTSVGVTRPHRVFLNGTGPFSEMVWKPLSPGRYGGYYESYRSEIAAYELDKLLALNMVPPTVERTIDRKVGAAVMWISARSFKELGGAPSAPPQYQTSWNRQLVHAKIFDNLIGNPDPNLGNWLVDGEWNVILIDHSRAFGTGKDLTHQITRIEKELWNRITALTEEQVAASPVGRWLDAGQIRAMFARRASIQKVVDALVKKNGAAAYVP